MFHKNILENTDNVHTPFNWVVADEAARLALVPIAADVYKALWQVDTGAVYILTGVSPIAWSEISGNANGSREILTADRTYYVRTDGNDSNSGLTNDAAGAFLTLQKASTVVECNLDLAGYNVTIQVADGVYPQGVTLPNYTGGGTVTFLGNPTTPSNVLINVTADNCFVLNNPRVWAVNGFKVQTTTSGRGFLIINGATLNYSNMDFGPCASVHLAIVTAKAIALTNYTISGSASAHAIITNCGVLEAESKVVTITGTPAFSLAFAYMRSNSVYSPFGSTFAGAATGARYNISLSAAIFVNGASTSFLPGNSAGFIASGAVYA